MPVTLQNETEITITIDEFRTLARKTKDALLPFLTGAEAQNVRFDEEWGSFEKRKPRAKYAGMATLGDLKVYHLNRYYKNSDSSKTLLAAYDTFLKKGNDSTGVFTNIKTALTANAKWKSLTFKDLWYGCNGVESTQVYNGSNVENIGVPVPAVPTFSLWTGTGLTGNYRYKITYFIDGYQEGTASIASDIVAPSNQGIRMNIPVSSNTRVTKRWLYRTQAGGTAYYFCKEIANNTATTVDDSVPDGSLDTAITAPNDYGAPDGVFKYMCLHKSRIFKFCKVGDSSFGVYSDVRAGVSYPDVFPAANNFYILRDSGDDGTAILEDNFGQLICFKPTAVVKINTDTDDPAGWSGFSTVLSTNGCIASNSAVKTPIGVIYLTRYAEGKKRLMLWNGQSSTPVFEELEPLLSSILESDLSAVVAHYHNNSYHFAYTDPDSGNLYNDRVLIINIFTGGWQIDKKSVNCFSSWNGGNDEGELYTGTSDGTGFIYREDTNKEDTLIQLKSQIDLGTLTSYLTSGGTEAAPTLSLNSGIINAVGAKTVSAVSDIVGDLTGEQDTVSPSGSYTSSVLEVKAKNPLLAFWNATLGTYGTVYFYIRAGNTSAAVQAASWLGPFTSSPANIAALPIGRYIQYRIKLAILGDNVANYADVFLSRGASPDDYVVRISFGYGDIIETSIEMLYLSSWLDFGQVSPFYKRVRKHFHQVRIEFERSQASGNLTFGYQLDGSSTRVDKDFAFSTYASKGYCIYKFPFSTFATTLKYRLYHADDTYSLKITAVHFTFTPQPFNHLM